MSNDLNVAVQQRFATAINSGKFDAANDSIDHDPATGQGPRPQGFRDMFSEMRIAFPDLHVKVEHLTDTDVALAYPITGTHQGTPMGHRYQW